MLPPNKLCLINLSIFVLFLYSISHAESNTPLKETNQLQMQIQQLQTQIADANSKITILETALNTTHQDINSLQNSETIKYSSRIQSNTANTGVLRTANGHGR